MLDRFDAFIRGITICYKSIQKIKLIEMTEFGLKGTHTMCIFYLKHHEEGLTAAQLCNLCSEDKAAISRSLSELSDRNYIYTDNDENKKKYRAIIHLTDAGKEVADKLDSLVAQWVEAGGEGLSEDERDSFYYALNIISENLKDSISQY